MARLTDFNVVVAVGNRHIASVWHDRQANPGIDSDHDDRNEQAAISWLSTCDGCGLLPSSRIKTAVCCSANSASVLLQ